MSTITDESGKTPAENFDFAKKYGLRYLEVRGVPGLKKHYSDLTEAELKAAAKEFAANGVKVSFFNSGQCKFALPGTEYVRQRTETPEQKEKRTARDQQSFDNRMETLHKSIRASQILGCDKVRIFAFLRTAEPEKTMQRVYDVFGPMVKVAEKEGIKLLLENEVACNVATCAELAAAMKAIPSKAFGINWDPLNGHHMKEEVFPHGYSLLPKKKVWNVQVKGKSILKEFPSDYLDWAAIYTALEKDGYSGQVGLECHIFGEEQIRRSHQCMEMMIQVAEQRHS
ncbi:MAG TPA: sugar phosphate isomerase/epimerase family protein [Bryobacteraceae bacterium]|nr:sugar phosphate isomerase/epimerase family protein [Bryobacteraceae bacterium]